MLYCSKCHALYENGTACSNCEGPLTEPKPGNLILLTAATYASSCEILDAFRARGIYIDRQPAIEEGVYELFVQYADWEIANETLQIVLEDLEKRTPPVHEPDGEKNKGKPELSRGKKWLLRILGAVAFGLAIWGVIALTDFAMSFVKPWFT